MAASFMKKTMAYLGLVDDDYDDYDDYDSSRRRRRSVGRPAPGGDRSTMSTSRPRPPRAPHPHAHPDETGGPAVAAAATVSTATGRRHPPRSGPSRPESAGARVHIVAPGRFADAQEIANRLMNNQPVIVNMQSADRDLQRRMIDFCSGVTYALSGGMERVADEVFLLTPSNVKVSDEERQRLADRGLVNP